MTIAKVFVDTAGWANFFVRSEPFHEEAIALMKQWREERTEIITTNYVLTELVALMTSPLRVPRAQQIAIVEGIKSADYITIIHIDTKLDKDAWELLKSRSDKNWSLVDCASMVVMQNRNIMTALTSDHHFEQAGFKIKIGAKW